MLVLLYTALRGKPFDAGVDRQLGDYLWIALGATRTASVREFYDLVERTYLEVGLEQGASARWAWGPT
jgi:hypothetical protein